MGKLFDVEVESHVPEAKEAFKSAREMALEMIGQKVEGYAFALAPADTGRLRNSITHVIKATEGRLYTYSDDAGTPYSYDIGGGAAEDEVHIGTNVEYAPYQELGTSKMKAQPFLRPAVERHQSEYVQIIKQVLDSTGDF